MIWIYLIISYHIVQPVFESKCLQFEFRLCCKTAAYLIESNSESYDRGSWLVFYLPESVCFRPPASVRLPQLARPKARVTRLIRCRLRRLLLERWLTSCFQFLLNAFCLACLLQSFVLRFYKSKTGGFILDHKCNLEDVAINRLEKRLYEFFLVIFVN